AGVTVGGIPLAKPDRACGRGRKISALPASALAQRLIWRRGMGMRSQDEANATGALLRLHLLRHGETQHSRQDRFCGHIYADLTPDGWRMAEAFGRRWAFHPTRPCWRAIYTSPRRRTIDMATPFAD